MNSQSNKLTVVEAAKICGVTRSTVWRWIKIGQLDAAITAGGHHRINETVLKEFMDRKKMYCGYRGELIKKILIVDDDPSIQKYFSRLFSEKEFELFYASDGFEAGMKTIKYKPNLLILDLFMPEMDGFKVCEQIKNEPETSKTKIIAISGYDTKENKNRILKIGADSFCPKPIDSIQMIKEIDRLMK
jgi:excisionase family DNA binding protein